jgi:PAS domain-containing protein
LQRVDITGSDRRREDWARLRQHFEVAADKPGQECWVHDLATDTVRWLPGHTPPVFVASPEGTPWSRVIDNVVQEDRGAMRAAHARACAQPGVAEAECRVQGPDGRQLQLLTRRVAMRGKDGQVRKVVGVSIDITEQRRASAALAQLNERQALVLDVARMALYR